MSTWDAMKCLDCDWTGDISDLVPMEGDNYGNERCPECGGLDVIDQEERKSARRDVVDLFGPE